MRIGLWLSALTALSTLTVGCAAETETVPFEPGGLRVLVAPQVVDGCEPTTAGNAGFPVGVNAIELRLTGAAETFSIRLLPDDLNEKGEILVEHVPVGDDLQLDLYGCTDGDLTWSGRATVDVAASDKTAPRLFFTRKNALSCPGSEEADTHGWRAEMFEAGSNSKTTPGRMMHTAVPVSDGHVLIIGGFNTYQPTTPTILQTRPGVVESITEYDPTRGLFRTWDAELASPRGAHHAVAFDGGSKVLVFGGVTRAALRPPSFPPLSPQPEDGADNADPEVAVELIDVAKRQVTESDLTLEPLPMAGVAAAPNGLTIVISGGAQASGEPTDLVTVISGSATELASGSATPVVTKLETPRMGHTANFFGPGHVLMVGGNFGNTASGYDTDMDHLAEVLPADSSTSVPVLIGEQSDVVVPMGLHQTVLASSVSCRHVFLVAGGMGLERDASVVPSFISAAKKDPRFMLLEIDACDPSAITGRFADQSAQFSDDTRIRRVFHSLTALGDGLVVMAGGYASSTPPQGTVSPLCVEGSINVGCYLADIMLIDVSGTSATPLASPELAFGRARFGHDVTLLMDGTALSTGGLQAHDDNSVDNVVPDAELLNPLRPGESGVCQ
ncbi:MAG: hypothetical protein ACI9WU_004947 [Myxococcota bacterium]|jgi:hypothetical protein